MSSSTTQSQAAASVLEESQDFFSSGALNTSNVTSLPVTPTTPKQAAQYVKTHITALPSQFRVKSQIYFSDGKLNAESLKLKPRVAMKAFSPGMVVDSQKIGFDIYVKRTVQSDLENLQHLLYLHHIFQIKFNGEIKIAIYDQDASIDKWIKHLKRREAKNDALARYKEAMETHKACRTEKTRRAWMKARARYSVYTATPEQMAEDQLKIEGYRRVKTEWVDDETRRAERHHNHARYWKNNDGLMEKLVKLIAYRFGIIKKQCQRSACKKCNPLTLDYEGDDGSGENEEYINGRVTEVESDDEEMLRLDQEDIARQPNDTSGTKDEECIVINKENNNIVLKEEDKLIEPDLTSSITSTPESSCPECKENANNPSWKALSDQNFHFHFSKGEGWVDASGVLPVLSNGMEHGGIRFCKCMLCRDLWERSMMGFSQGRWVD